MNREARLEHYVRIVMLLLEDYSPQDRDDALIMLAARCIEERRKRKSSQYHKVLREDVITEVDSPEAKALIALAEVRRQREDSATTEPGNPKGSEYHVENPEEEDTDGVSHAAAAEMRWQAKKRRQ